MSNSSIIQNNIVYRQSPQTNNFGTVQALITAATPLGETYNGQKKLTQLVKSLSDQFSQGNVAFKPISNQFQFDLYRATKPKVIFSKYITRVVPDASSNTQSTPNQYYPVVSFKIDFEACCVGGMCLNFTTDIQVRDYKNSTVVINGYSSNGAVQDVAVSGSSIQSFQIAYGLDFAYNYIDKIKLGFCNVGGGNIIWHQEVPAEIAKVYHSIIEPPGMSETIRRMVREDVFVIQHNPYHMYGDFAFQLKNDNALNQYTSVSGTSPNFEVNRTAINSSMEGGFNEIGIYWVDTKIKQINMTPAAFNNKTANRFNYTISNIKPEVSGTVYTDTGAQGIAGRKLVGFEIMALAPFLYGSQLTVSYNGGAEQLIGQLPVAITSGNNDISADIFAIAPTFTANGTQAVKIIAELNIPSPVVQGQLNFRIHFAEIDAQSTGSFTLSETDANNNPGVLFTISALAAALNYIQQTYMNGVPTGSLTDSPAGTVTVTGTTNLIDHVDGYTNQGSVFIQHILQYTYALLLKTTGAVCPYLNVGNFNYMNIEIEKYNDNDYALNGLQWYYMQGNYRNTPNPPNVQAQYQIYRYNAAILNNHANEEYSPTLQNVDYQSIHTFRRNHGIVDFYFPLGFLFICQGVRRSFPHYACSAQSIKVEFTFNNPISLMNTCLAVNPTSIDFMDYSNNCRLFINRVDNFTWLQSNGNNMAFVLYYTKYVWIPTLIKAIMNYPFYSWPQKNYERFTASIDNSQFQTTKEICQLSRSVFYTKVYMFVTSYETAQIMSYGGGPSGILPLYINKYDLPIYDVLDYAFTNQYGNNLTGADQLNYTKTFNSVYSYVPFESVQLVTDSQLHMTDETPFRAQMFLDYVCLEWTQSHSAIKLNNLVQFNLDSVFYQVDAPNAVYSPAYGPYIKVMVKPKQMVSEINANRYGVIVISECVNISYIQNHVMMVKFQTNN